jgi:hypothetical protein
LGAPFDDVAFFARRRAGSALAAALLVAVRALGAVSVPALADFAGAFVARVAAFGVAFAAVLLGRFVVVEPLADLADDRFAPAVAWDLAAVRFTGSSVADRALVAAT